MPRVGDLFDVRNGHNLELVDLLRSTAPGALPFVSCSRRNNGVTGRVARLEGLEPGRSGEITVAKNGSSACAAFVQPDPFYAGSHVAILTARKPMTDAEKLWWCLCIWTNRFRFSYGRKANRTLPDLELPEMPSWCEAVRVPDLAAVRSASMPGPPPSLDVAGWGTFRYDQLFNFERGERVINRELQPGTTPYVRASERRNGIVAFGELPLSHAAGSITVPYNGNSVGKAFYQPRPFFASDDVIVLVPKRPLTPAAAHFLCALIRAERFRFSYGRKWNMERMTGSVMRLPVTPEGEPDWDLMARFVLSLPYSSSIGG